jgi:hypothetical protein
MYALAYKLQSSEVQCGTVLHYHVNVARIWH